MNSQKIAAIIITRNEEKNIRECLQSVKWADEIMVIDAFSTDNTLKIARQFTREVYKRKWPGYSLQKNFGIERAKYDWILSVDADERITPQLKDEIQRVLENNNSYSGYYIPRRNIYFGKFLKFGGNYPDYQLRLFNRIYGKFRVVEVHEGVELKGKVGKLKNPMIHYTYNNLEDYFSKFHAYTRLESRILARKKASISIVGIIKYLFFQPVRKFIDRYILKFGFLDGYQGFLAIILTIITKITSYLYYKESASGKGGK